MKLTARCVFVDKSWFMEFILCQRLAEGLEIVYQPSSAKQQGIFWFSAGGVKFIPARSTGPTMSWPKDPEVWVLVDDVPLPELSDVVVYRNFFLCSSCGLGKHPASM